MAVDKQIMNRRQGVLITAIDPEILTETKLSTDGFVKNTDYASDNTGGVIKTSSGAATTTGASGALICVTRTLAQYGTANNNIFISKGTLETVIQDVIERMLATALDDSYTSAEVGTVWRVLLRKAEGGPAIDFAVQT